ncbi:linear amide C-N hydrolase [Flammeovirga sp. SJP92]|uniref:linear amide C-N hydrolase n=1 Tax=Flammeovirga sp. SJP92 TaxID=1775430 RepID=UPI000787BCD5|nr:linear amide C-N hydrolase [Flammeovirga sp. SJP92]KXX71497.1 hypothetical protein AVL50_06245 [Flammeovirga sp. SJP92]
MKKKVINFSILISLILSYVVVPSIACTRILWNTGEKVIVGRNEDFASASNPTLVLSGRGTERVGTSDEAKIEKAVTWDIKYGSLVVFANNRFPMDGMNEKGLTARTLFFSDGDPNQHLSEEEKNEKKLLDSDHWISYILDNFSTVNEAVNSIKNDVYLASVPGRKKYSYATPKHISIADATGNSAVIEIQNGEVKIFEGSQYKIMTNPPKYQDMMAKTEASQLDIFSPDFPTTFSGEDRFLRANYWVNQLPKPHNSDDVNTAYGFMYMALGNVAFIPGMPLPDEDQPLMDDIVANLSHPDESYGSATYFQSISNLTDLHYRFKSLTAPSDIYFDFSSVDFNTLNGVSIIKRVENYAQNGWSGEINDHLQEIEGDIYAQEIE